MGVRATFLEVEADTSLLRIESGIFQQVEQDTFQLFFIRFYLEFGGVYSCLLYTSDAADE